MATTAEIDQHEAEVSTIAGGIQGAVTTALQLVQTIDEPFVYQLRTDLQQIASQAQRLHNLSPLQATE
jgi:hypothetical protein